MSQVIHAKRDALASVLQAVASRIRGERKAVSLPYGFSMGSFEWGAGWSNPSNEKLVKAGVGYTGMAISLIAREVAAVPLELYETRGDEWESVEYHESLDVLGHPGPRMTLRRLLNLTEISLLTFGNGLWLLEIPAKGFAPIGICFVPWESVMPEYDKGKRLGIVGWKIGPTQRFYPAEQCIHFTEDDITTPSTGLGRSPMIRVADAIDMSRGAAEANARYIRIGSIISMILSRKDGEAWGEDAKRAIEQDLSMDHGGAKNAHRALLTEGDIDVKMLAPGNTDMDFSDALKWSMEMELANLFVSPAMIGMVKDHNRANMDAALAQFQRLAVLPRVERYLGSGEEKHSPGILEMEFFSHWDTKRGGEWRVSHGEIVSRDRAEDRADAKMQLGEGTGISIADINEVRERFGFTERDEADAKELFIAAGKLKLSEERPNQQPMQFSLGGPVESKSVESRARAAERHMVWKRFAVQHAKFEKRLTDGLKPEYKKQEAEVIGRIKRNYPKAISLFGSWGRAKARQALLERRDIIDDIFPKNDHKRIMRAVEPVYKDAIKEAARGTYRKLGVRVPKKDGALFDLPGISNPITEEAVDEFLNDAALVALAEVDDKTLKKLKAAFADVVSENGGLDEIVSRIQDVYEEFDRFRAFTIARTEMTGAWNWGEIEAAKSLDLNLKKHWLAANDGREREAHAEASQDYGDGDGIGLDESFDVGGEALQHPGDPDASPENKINCRCTQYFTEVES